MEGLKLHFWDNLNFHPERTPFRDTLKTLGIKTSINLNDLEGVNLLFIHGGDSHLLNGYTFQENVFKVSFGDNPTELKQIFIDENRISFINASELNIRFEKIYEELNNVDELTIEILYIIIFGFSSKLEELLQPFANSSPFQESNKLKEAKKALKDYIKSKA